MELAQPTIAEAIAECAELGASKVIVAPFFLSRWVVAAAPAALVL